MFRDGDEAPVKAWMKLLRSKFFYRFHFYPRKCKKIFELNDKLPSAFQALKLTLYALCSFCNVSLQSTNVFILCLFLKKNLKYCVHLYSLFEILFDCNNSHKLSTTYSNFKKKLYFFSRVLFQNNSVRLKVWFWKCKSVYFGEK